MLIIPDDFYLEIKEDQWKSLSLPGPYIHIPYGQTHKSEHYMPPRLYLASNRIWAEIRVKDKPYVYFYKNIISEIKFLNAEELEEFFWIKLQAHRIQFKY